jgi:hypothetical protein
LKTEAIAEKTLPMKLPITLKIEPKKKPLGPVGDSGC